MFWPLKGGEPSPICCIARRIISTTKARSCVAFSPLFSVRAAIVKVKIATGLPRYEACRSTGLIWGGRGLKIGGAFDNSLSKRRRPSCHGERGNRDFI
jgi:hypothetical protein